MAYTASQLAQIEAVLDTKFYGADNWEINAYTSPSEKQINKPILPTTNRATNRMGHMRNYPGPDTPLVQAVFFNQQGNKVTAVFTDTDGALDWLLRQEQGGIQVQP